MTDIAPLILTYIVFLAAMISPGPDFLIVLRNSLGYGAKAGIGTAAGIALALSVHVAYCLAGIGLLISQSIVLFTIVKWIGAAYLVYIGIGALRSKGMTIDEAALDKTGPQKTVGSAFMEGIITNIFNPKATLFFLAMFTQMIDPATPVMAQAVFGGACMLTAFIWFSLVAAVMGIRPVRQAYARASKAIDRTLGVFFIGLAARLALAKAA